MTSSALPREWFQQLFARDGAVQGLRVTFPLKGALANCRAFCGDSEGGESKNDAKDGPTEPTSSAESVEIEH